jgi:hypothetical protein
MTEDSLKSALMLKYSLDDLVDVKSQGLVLSLLPLHLNFQSAKPFTVMLLVILDYS